MYKKLLAILLCLCLLSGCSQLRPVSTNVSSSDGNAASGDAKVEIIVTDKPSAAAALPSKLSLGDVTFTVDSGKVVTGIVPIGKEKIISAVDSSGTEWTLTIPANAVPANTKITITPLGKIKSAGYPGTITGGVMLEPDGLTFDTNGTLSVKMPKDVPIVMLTGDGKGGDLCFLGSKQNGGAVTASIAHFSTMYFEPTDDLTTKELQNRTQEGYETILELVKELLKQPIEVPSPPTITLECYTDNKLAQAKAYAKQALLPESLYLQTLINYGSAMTLSGSKAADEESFRYARRILERLVRKADRILKESKQDPDKFLPTAEAVIGIYNRAANFGVEVPSPSDAIGPYADKTAEHCLKEIRDKHNFKYIRGALETGRLSALLGNKSNVQRLLDALTFKAEYKLVVTLDGSGEYPMNAAWHLKGQAEVKSGSRDGTVYQGEGEAEYESFVCNYSITMSLDGPFPIMAWITKFDPCESGTAVLEFDKLSLASENYTSTEDPSIKTSGGMVKGKIDEFFLKNGKYTFTLPINNGQTEVCSNTESGSTVIQGVSIASTINIKLTHTPK